MPTDRTADHQRSEPSLDEAIAGERADLAALLRDLDETSWDAPSLCDGWRVREVVAHITMPFRYTTRRFVRGMLAAWGRYGVMADRAAQRDAATMSSDELVTAIEDNLHHPWKPPGAPREAALAHDVIHGLDITVALGLDRRVPLDRLRMVLDAQTPRSVAYFDADLDGVALQADDLDWTYGHGSIVTGLAQHLLLVQCGRQLPPTLLDGAHAGRFVRGD